MTQALLPLTVFGMAGCASVGPEPGCYGGHARLRVPPQRQDPCVGAKVCAVLGRKVLAKEVQRGHNSAGKVGIHRTPSRGPLPGRGDLTLSLLLKSLLPFQRRSPYRNAKEL
jgi:hypothetical protein